MTGRCASQRKVKATNIPKPARGSGLNPSGLPVADQLHLPAEQPRMSAFNFDPYGQSGLGWSGYDNVQEQVSLFFGDAQPEGPSSFGDSPAQGPSLYDNPPGPSLYDNPPGPSLYDNLPGPSSFNNLQGLSSSSFNNLQGPSSFDNLTGLSFYNNPQGSSSFDDNAQGPSSFNDNAQGPSSFSNQQGPLFYNNSQGALLYDKRPYYEDTRDNSTSPGPSHHQQGLAPVPRWVEGAPGHGVGIVNRGWGLNPPASDLSMIRQGEIPANEVVHTSGPARTTTTHAARRNTPPTPYLQPRMSVAEAQPIPVAEQPSDPENKTSTLPPPQGTIRLTMEVIKQTMKSTKKLVTRIVFSKHAMSCSKKRKRRLIDNVIQESVPNLFGPDALFEDFITSAHRRTIGNTLSAKRGKLIDFACEGVNIFINGADPLVFMHDFYFDKNNNLIVRARFQSCFVMSNVIHFIWYWGQAAYLGLTPRKTLKHVLAVASAATYCSLYEQGKDELDVDPFGGPTHEAKFNNIIRAMNNLTPVELAEFESYLDYILATGPSQGQEGGNSSIQGSD
ncbi:hypothetical protein CY34DRAFT_18745 [Suillus luteus UH-Slu-Lm8-n1]|uniref:Uncharacterized protein n=1 Tax=Suillus luteus UH-Slu-Lm8-n1 TaxID=930992 RepID=A0A0D0AF97_9AGAM|nr:hypothetical protein CY34DRAFT_18745 [Suillus luteus UH-Slu-Lm8-n1]